MDAVGVRSRRPALDPSARVALALFALALALSSCSSSRNEPAPDRTTGPESDAGDRMVVTTRPRSRSPSEFARLEGAIRRFASDRAGRLPGSLDELVTERSPEGDRYLASVPSDAWGRPYSYAVVSARLGAYDLRSYGPDTLPDTADDVVADPKPVPVH